MKTTINKKTVTFEDGQLWSDIIDVPGALGVLVEGDSYALDDPAQENRNVTVLTYFDEEGRRIYERTLQFIFIAACNRVLPKKRVRIEHSFGNALYVNLPGTVVTWSLVNAIEKEMHNIVDADMPLGFTETTREEALKYYEQVGELDKLRLLKYRNYPTFHFNELDGMKEYFYGELCPSAGYIKVFKLHLYMPGILISLPSQKDPSQLAPRKDYPKMMKAYSETGRWNGILGCENAADINEMMENKTFREFIRVNEELHSRSISEIAMAFVNSGARLICIAGPSSSGKTTFANRMYIALRCLGLHPVTLSLDNYYRNRDEIEREPDGSIDLERMDTLDLPLLDEHLVKLIQGEEIDMPVFDFVTSRRMKETVRMKVDPGQPLIIEGIHGLNDALCPSVPRDMKFKIYTSALTMINLDDHNRIRTTDARLLRRIVRDYKFRGTSPEETIAMWSSVRAGEDRWIFPFQEEADVIFNSSLAYEIPVLKAYAYDLLDAIKPESPCYTIARRIVKFLNYFYVIDVEDEIPLNSVLREFTGGCCFYKEEPEYEIRL